MAHSNDSHKETAGEKGERGLVTRCIYWIESHPRTGWYIAVMATLNVILNLLDAVDFW